MFVYERNEGSPVEICSDFIQQQRFNKNYSKKQPFLFTDPLLS